MTPLQALRIIELEIEASDIQLSEGSALVEALNSCGISCSPGEGKSLYSRSPITMRGFGGQDITYEREPCPLSRKFPRHLPGLLVGCTCEAPDA